MLHGNHPEDGGIIVQCDYNLKPMYAVRQDICYFFYDYKYGWNENREGPQSMSLSGLTPGTKYNYCTRMTVPIIRELFLQIVYGRINCITNKVGI